MHAFEVCDLDDHGLKIVGFLIWTAKRENLSSGFQTM